MNPAPQLYVLCVLCVSAFCHATSTFDSFSFAYTNLATGNARAIKPLNLSPQMAIVSAQPTVKIIPSVAVSRVAYTIDATLTPAAAGYKIYTGPATGFYNEVSDVGTNLSGFISTSFAGRIFGAVTQYDAQGNESDFSDEAWFPPWTNIVLVTGATNMARALNLPRTTVTGDIALTNPPPGSMFYFGNPAKITHLLQ